MQQRFGRVLPDTHGAVALHVAVAAHRARTSTEAADVAAHEQQVDDHLNRGHRILVLGDAHAPARNGAAGLGIHICRTAHVLSTQAGLFLQQLPGLGAQILQQRVKTGGVLSNEGMVQHLAPGIVPLDQGFHHAFDEGKVAAYAQLKVVAADGGVAQGGHFQLILRVGKALQPTLAHRVDAHNARTALGSLAQLAQHARVVGAGVLAEDKDGLGLRKVIQRDGALAYANALAHAGAAGLVAHVGAIGEVVGAVLAHKQLVQERRLVAGAPGGVERGLVRVRQSVEVFGDQAEGVVPADGAVVVGLRVVDHGLGQAAVVFQGKVALQSQFGHAVLRKKVARNPACGGFRRYGFGAVFAKLEG